MDEPSADRQGPHYGNLVLDGLSPATIELLALDLRRRHLHRSQVIARRGKPLTRVLFPGTSVVLAIERFRTERVAVLAIGNESAIGTWPGSVDGLVEADLVCEIPGDVYAVSSRSFGSAVIERPELAGVVSLTTHGMVGQLMRNVACVARHPLSNRCARMVLELAIRLGNEFPLTHEGLAELLGVTRPSATREMARLARAQILEYRRGIIRVVAPAALEAAACHCFQTLLAQRRALQALVRTAGAPGTVR